jgi:RNA 2',3'-cyclic 3'-phosphodiesterase
VEVIDALERLARPDESGVRWTTPDQWHITLRFLGAADPDVAGAALDEVAAPRADVVLGPRVERLGGSAVVVPAAGLDPISAAVRATTAEIGDPPDGRPFVGHLTLGRRRDGGPTALDGQAFLARFTATELALVRSDLHADGARYTTLAIRSLDS